MDELHEPAGELTAETRDLHRALQSLKEEIEAIDWYHQRSQLAKDPELMQILQHNRNEEMEHACIILEWLRRRMPGWNEQMTTYLFSEGPILELEHAAQNGAESSAPPAGRAAMRSLGLKLGREEK